jgi:two-component system cell cycle response regulator DivK
MAKRWNRLQLPPKEAATREFVAPCQRCTSRINGALSLGEQFRQVVRLLRLTCRAADGPAPPSLTLNRHGHSKSWTMPLIGVNLAWANRPDLILMDIRLPHISGLEVTRRLRDDDRSKEIPIIAVTAFAMEWHEREALDNGCDAYLSKPITILRLLDAIEPFLFCPLVPYRTARRSSPLPIHRRAG